MLPVGDSLSYSVGVVDSRGRTSSTFIKSYEVVDYEIVYNDSYIDQMLEYGKKYSTL